ncbi:hypothetical protein M378DRAFT_161578 [Amanita muscaria Koide BX008]|uniref:Uncharacterized protein n=1 Tax=Amanita muscaria (strain Koide BX008) TaxID=946122 RepID=A0A0C2SRJ7_AMAMK|nr:hypothetical protein M378DRAFT_161578 [Amanita muscaria Koide BX008]
MAAPGVNVAANSDRQCFAYSCRTAETEGLLCMRPIIIKLICVSLRSFERSSHANEVQSDLLIIQLPFFGRITGTASSGLSVNSNRKIRGWTRLYFACDPCAVTVDAVTSLGNCP